MTLVIDYSNMTVIYVFCLMNSRNVFSKVGYIMLWY